MIEFFQKAKTNYKLAVDQSSVQDFFTIFVVRPIASVIAVICYKLRFSPNQLTSFGLIIHAMSLWMIISGSYLIASFGFLITYILDCSDGQLARFTNKVTQFGKYYDLIADFVKESTLYLVLIYVRIDLGFSPLLFSISYFVIMYSFFADWIYKNTIRKETSNKKLNNNSLKKLFKIQYWNVGIRNLVYIIAIGSNNFKMIPYFVLSIGSLMTIQKYYRIFNRLKTLE